MASVRDLWIAEALLTNILHYEWYVVDVLSITEKEVSTTHYIGASIFTSESSTVPWCQN